MGTQSLAGRLCVSARLGYPGALGIPLKNTLEHLESQKIYARQTQFSYG
jgi:hypothetical protein